MNIPFNNRIFFLALFILLHCSSSYAQQTAEKLVTETGYLLYLPEQYHDDTLKKWPLLIFLHGSGESGHDIEKVKLHGPPQLIQQGRKFPFIVVSPQNDVPSGWNIDNVYNLLQHIKRNYHVDAQRIYLTGLSMGGFGTFALAMKHPEEFAAIAPICGGGDTTDAWKLRNMAVWSFHGFLDNVVPPIGTINMMKAISRYNAGAQLTIYPDKNHNAWDTTYNANDILYNWLLSKRKSGYVEKTIDVSIFKKYAGRYVGPDNDTVQIISTSKGLTAFPGRDTVALKAADNNLFFLRPDKDMDIRFQIEGNKIKGFLFMGDRKLAYRRID